jgi:UDP-galactopyranose mutase
MSTVDAVVAGAGIWGCTVARRLAEAGLKVLVLEKREAVGGNSRCEFDGETGIEVHLYGSHILHTSIPEVWDFIRRFTEFNGYQHKGMTTYKGKTYYLPLGLSLINSFFNINLKPSEVSGFMADEAHSKAIFDAFFRGYTAKQWGKPPEDVDPSVIKRIPVRDNYDVNYYNDYNQGIPKDGYAAMFSRMLSHPNIEVRCNAAIRLDDDKFKVGGDELPEVPVYYSGPVDELFGYSLGALPWRTLRFETERLDVKDFQGTSMLNYPDIEVPFTRIHEFKHFHPEDSKTMAIEKTIIAREYPGQWKLGDEPYYPIAGKESEALLGGYRQLASEVPGLVLGGRLGTYRYLDMDKSMADALALPLQNQFAFL